MADKNVMVYNDGLAGGAALNPCMQLGPDCRVEPTKGYRAAERAFWITGAQNMAQATCDVAVTGGQSLEYIAAPCAKPVCDPCPARSLLFGAPTHVRPAGCPPC